MTYESSKAAEELFHRTIKKFTEDPLENLSPEMRQKMKRDLHTKELKEQIGMDKSKRRAER